ncbi:DEAD/DEAH box helicase domain protein [Methanolacinia petrolearia DSM 11571]|uniref:DEAD/DEAH box helicase domain protein n=1 Tax=Methanolacinia petrolearia (strain DSM 11571 / OCM 486 / SEBR 4847) TaxID=679926 RepID=E1RK19_METP4|nr:DEAD/DEAH box helicase [Methanolacinia petrolearia]ADN35742.1 DEAD/DEAH box helicase domain protein [Methanolacinia petrolearia DSM 11571]
MLDAEIRKLLDKRSFDELSDTQEEAIPPIMQGHHTLCIAPTGTGKTESAMLPVFHKLLRDENRGRGFRALYITPLRSLNRDILSRLKWWCGELGLTVGVRHGDTTQAERARQSRNPPDLLITTPETVQALFMGKNLREHLKSVRYVVIDEIHELAGSKRGVQLSVALERIVEQAGEFQRIALSATVGNPEDVARFLCGERPYHLVNIPSAPRLSIDVKYAGGEFSSQAKFVSKLIDRNESVLIFVNTRTTAEALGQQLFDRGDVEVHHGSLSREVRIEAEEKFKNRKIKALICTSSMELGLDIGHIGHVLQFGSPREVSRLLQRVGRAGHRLDTVSRGTILATSFDDLVESLVIAKKATSNECEDVVIPENAADVIANQVSAMALEYGEIPEERIVKILGKTAVFNGFEPLLDRVLSQLEYHRMIRRDAGTVIRTGRCRKYMYSNLSMIHDEKKVKIFDILTRRTVGTLDESFVISWIHTGAVFVTKGQLWQVLAIEDGMVKVEPAVKMRGELPSWEGEQIPVPYAVAQESGSIRRKRKLGKYDADKVSENFILQFLDGMDHARSPVASDRLMTIEHYDEGVVMNLCGGHKANEALGRLISILLSARFGTTVGVEIGAYRILLRLPREIGAVDVLETINSIDPDHIRGLLEIALKRTAIFRWKVVQIAKKFGAIDADADYEKFSMHKLIDLFEGTAIQEEAFRELFSDYMDVACAELIVKRLVAGDIDIQIAPLSALGREGLTSSRDMIPPPATDKAVINAVKRRIENDNIILFCMNCRKWKSKTVVSRVPDDDIVCPVCGARLIAALKPYEEHMIDTVRRKDKSAEDRAVEVKMLRNANIVLSSGKKAVRAFAARGVGPDTASRIIGTFANGDQFYLEILKAERNYIKTHRFWN